MHDIYIYRLHRWEVYGVMMRLGLGKGMWAGCVTMTFLDWETSDSMRLSMNGVNAYHSCCCYYSCHCHYHLLPPQQ